MYILTKLFLVSGKIQRKETITRLKKDSICEIVGSEEEFNSNDTSIYTVEIPVSCSMDITDDTGDTHNDFELDQDNHKTDEKKLSVYPEKTNWKYLPGRISKQQRHAVLAAWKTEKAKEIKSKKTCAAALEERQELEESYECENDLCINVASFVKLGSQMKDIDPGISLEQCFVCNKGPFVGSDSMSSHIKEIHPG